MLIGAQLATFASQLLLPKLEETELPGNLIFSLLQVWLLPIPYVLVVVCFFSLPLWPLYLLTVIAGQLRFRLSSFLAMVFMGRLTRFLIMLSSLDYLFN